MSAARARHGRGVALTVVDVRDARLFEEVGREGGPLDLGGLVKVQLQKYHLTIHK